MFKKVYLALIFTFILGSISYAQPLSMGPVLGANFMSISNTTNAQPIVGLRAGGFLNYSIDEKWGINAKLLFSQMGAARENSEYTARLNYIQLPLSLVYFFGQSGDKLRPKLFLGPYLGYLLNAKDNNGNKILAQNGNDLYSKLDFGGQIGAGLNYIISDRTWLNIDASYSSSFVSIIDAADPKNRNNGFQFTAGISFPIGDEN